MTQLLESSTKMLRAIRRRGKRLRHIVFLPAPLFALFGALVLALSFTASEIEVCEPRSDGDGANCRYEPIVFGAVLRVVHFANAYNGAWMVLLTTVLAILTTLQYLTLTAQHETERAVQRPWLKILRPQVKSLEFREHGIVMRAVVGVKNVGNTPATNVHIANEFAPLPLFELDLNRGSQRAAASVEYFRSMVIGRAVFPGDEAEEERIFHIGPVDFQAMCADSKRSGAEGAILVVGLCVRYSFGGGHGTTTADFVVSAPGGRMVWTADTNGFIEGAFLTHTKRGEAAH